MARTLRSRGAYCLIAATLAVGLRLALYDFEFFILWRFPNHDMSQGAGFFVPNLHSLRLSGEIAWWKSNAQNGYAHYFQTFFSPLAPTPGHIVFVLWTQFALALDLIGLRLSEYLHYLTITYVVLPWLAVASFCWLVSLFVERRIPILFAGVAYALSGIGLWQGAWFYFQEPATLNLLLASSIALLRRPTQARLLAFLAAVLVQVSSINYWTLYNLFFVVLFLGGYVAFHPMQLRDAWATIWRGRHFVACAVIVAAVWGGLLASIMAEQSGRYVRTSMPEGYTAEKVIAQAQVLPLADVLSGLVKRNEVSRDHSNPMHHARYVGVLTILLAICALLVRPNRIVAWAFISAVGVMWISRAPAPMVWLWLHIPMMDRIIHLFYFYPHFLAQLIVLLAAIGLDRIVTVTKFATVRIAAAGVILVTTAVDLALYYRAVSRLDAEFSKTIWGFTMTPEKQRQLATPLPHQLDSTRGFEGGVRQHLPIVALVFPDNNYLLAPEHMDLAQGGDSGRMAAHLATTGAPVAFFPREAAFRFSGRLPDVTAWAHRSLLVLHEASNDVPPFDPGRISPVAQRIDLSHRAQTWTYNTFTFEIDAPADGWLYLAQLPDPVWSYSIDGRPVAAVRANFVGTAVPITAGSHRIRLDYRPTARLLYWPAVALLELTLMFFAVAILLGLASRRSGARKWQQRISWPFRHPTRHAP